METVLKMELPWRTMRSKLVKCDQDDDYVQYSTTFEECQIRHRYSGVSQLVRSQLAFFINLQRAVIGPSATLTSRLRPAIDLCRMRTGFAAEIRKCLWVLDIKKQSLRKERLKHSTRFIDKYEPQCEINYLHLKKSSIYRVPEKINPFMPCRLFYYNSLDRSISNKRCVWLVSIITMFYRNSCTECKQCRPWSDAAFAASDLSLHCLSMSLSWNVRHEWVNQTVRMWRLIWSEMIIIYKPLLRSNPQCGSY